MIYICVPSHNDAKTVGLLLWKVRQVFGAFPREYHLLVANDGSTDATREVLESYLHVLSMTILDRDEAVGYAATVEDLLQRALQITDRPKRDCVVLLNGDFSVSPNVLPDLIRALESGADVVVAETDAGARSPLRRMLQWASSWLLRPGVNLPGVQDAISGVCAIRLVTIKRCLAERAGGARLLRSDGIAARAELVARAAAYARQITAVAVNPQDVRHGATGHERPIWVAMELFRAGRALRIPPPERQVRRAS